jgi:predicted secreted protein
MRPITIFLLVVGIGALIVSACTAQLSLATATAAPAVTVDTAITTNPTAENTIEPMPDGQKVVTRDDRGKTISLTVGENFLLKLGDEYTWEFSISDQAVLSRVKNIAVIRGAQGVYLATKPGTVTVSAAGDPLCRQSQPPCMMPSILFEFTVQVK